MLACQAARQWAPASSSFLFAAWTRVLSRRDTFFVPLAWPSFSLVGEPRPSCRLACEKVVLPRSIQMAATFFSWMLLKRSRLAFNDWSQVRSPGPHPCASAYPWILAKLCAGSLVFPKTCANRQPPQPKAWCQQDRNVFKCLQAVLHCFVRHAAQHQTHSACLFVAADGR